MEKAPFPERAVPLPPLLPSRGACGNRGRGAGRGLVRALSRAARGRHEPPRDAPRGFRGTGKARAAAPRRGGRRRRLRAPARGSAVRARPRIPAERRCRAESQQDPARKAAPWTSGAPTSSSPRSPPCWIEQASESCFPPGGREKGAVPGSPWGRG